MNPFHSCRSALHPALMPSRPVCPSWCKLSLRSPATALLRWPSLWNTADGMRISIHERCSLPWHSPGNVPLIHKNSTVAVLLYPSRNLDAARIAERHRHRQLAHQRPRSSKPVRQGSWQAFVCRETAGKRSPETLQALRGRWNAMSADERKQVHPGMGKRSVRRKRVPRTVPADVPKTSLPGGVGDARWPITPTELEGVALDIKGYAKAWADSFGNVIEPQVKSLDSVSN